jgi:hypothetical protein
MAAHNSMRFSIINNFHIIDNEENFFGDIQYNIIKKFYSNFYEGPIVKNKVMTFLSKLQTLGSVQTCLHQNGHNLFKF